MQHVIVHITHIMVGLTAVAVGFVAYDLSTNWRKVRSLHAALRGVKWYVPEFESVSGKTRFSYHCGLGTLMVETDLVRVTWYDERQWSGAVRIRDLMPVVQWVLTRKLYTRLNSNYRRDRDKFDHMLHMRNEVVQLAQFKTSREQRS